MQHLTLLARPQFRDVTKALGQAAVGALTIGILHTARYFDPIKTANLFGRIARSIGPMMREQKLGRANLTAAIPEKSPAEIETISQASGTISVELAPNSRILMTSGSTIPHGPRIAGSQSRNARTNYSRNCGSTANQR